MNCSQHVMQDALWLSRVQPLTTPLAVPWHLPTLPLLQMSSTTLSFLPNGASSHFSSSYCHQVSCDLLPVEPSFAVDTGEFICLKFLFGPKFLFLNSLPTCDQDLAMVPLPMCAQVYFEWVSDM
jgi:hypothetical protein